MFAIASGGARAGGAAGEAQGLGASGDERAAGTESAAGTERAAGRIAGEDHGTAEGLDRLAPSDQARMERELGRLMSQAQSLDESNPREMGAFMRRMTDVAGLPRDAAMEEAIRRMEAGEDPERVEEDLGDLLGGDPGEGEGDGDGGGGGYGGYKRDGGMYGF